MKRKGHQFDCEMNNKIHQQWRKEADGGFKAVLETQHQRFAEGVAKAPNRTLTGSFLDILIPEETFSDKLSKYERIHPLRDSWHINGTSWGTKQWSQLQENEITHYFSNDIYPRNGSAGASPSFRRGTNWAVGDWGLGNYMLDFISEDDFLSSDGVHLWMWCLVPNAHHRLPCFWYVKGQFQQLFDTKKYYLKFPNESAAFLMDRVYMFHVHDQLQIPTEENKRQKRHRTWKAIESAELNSVTLP